MRTQQSSNKIFIVIIALLLIANIATLAMLFGGKKYEADDHKNLMRNYLKSEVGFTEKQLQDFDTIKSEHRAQMKQVFDTMREHKKENLKKLSAAAFSDSALTNTASAAASEQENAEMNMLKHLRDIRNLCTPAQKSIFDTGFYKIMTRPPALDEKNK